MGGRRREEHYGKGTTFSRAVTAALSFCHSEELQFRGICFAASPDREQGFPRRLPPARDYERRGSIGTSKTRALPKICADVSRGWAARRGHCGKGTHSCVPLRFEIRFRADQAQLRMREVQRTPIIVISSEARNLLSGKDHRRRTQWLV